MLFDSPTQKFGYIDIKQSSKVKGRKLKTWRRRWVVLTKMTDMSSEELVAKLDLYGSESSWRNQDPDRTTFMLENVTSVQPAQSKTHPHAFEIVERRPMLVLSGVNDLDSYSWMLTLQQMLTPEQIDTKKDSYSVLVVSNEFSQKWNLSGQLTMTVSPASISLVSAQRTCAVSWGLSTLIRFNVEKNAGTGLMNILMIECGPNSPTGQSCFRFESDEAQEILSVIRQSICLVLAQKQNARKTSVTRSRAVSVTVSEKGFQHLLDNSPFFIDHLRDRSESDSSNSITGTSPTVSVSPATIKLEQCASSAALPRHNPELEALEESDEHFSSEKKETQNSRVGKKESGYSVISDVNGKENRAVSDKDELGDEAMERLKSVSSGDIHSEWSKSERPTHYSERFSGSALKSATSIRTMTLPIMSDEKRCNPNFQEVMNINDSEEPLDNECLSKRRSSSLGDIHLFKRLHEAKAENDYEELDELRASVQKLQLSKKSDLPPALPARPSSKSFLQNNSNLIENKKRKFFKKAEKTNSQKCSCVDIGADRLRFVSDSGRCVVCQGSVEVKKTNRNGRVSKEDVRLPSSRSSLNDIYACIPEVSTNLTKRRRSSDITPVSSNFYSTCEVSRLEAPPRRPASFHENFSVLDPNHPATGVGHLDRAAASHLPVPRTVQSKSSDPLISFFVDDEHFMTNPLVVSQMSNPGINNHNSTPTTPPTSPNPIDLLTSDDFPGTSSPISPEAGLTFFGHSSSAPTTSASHFTSVTPAMQLPFPVWASQPTTPVLWTPNPAVWNPIFQTTAAASQDESYMTMRGSDIFAQKNCLLADDISGVYVGPCDTGDKHV